MQRSVATAILLAAATSGVEAAVFTVSTIDNDGPGSLRQAILDANGAASPPHAIEFGDAFPADGMIELFGPLPALTVAAEIDGRDRNPTVMPFDPSNSFPLLRTNRGLTLRGFQLMQGRADVRGGCVGGEGVGSAHALVIHDMRFSGCTAVVSSGTTAATGGAVSWPSTAPVTITDSIFQGNAAVSVSGAAASGGAVAANGPIRIASSYFFSNIVNGRFVAGGAVQVNLPLPGEIEIRGSVFVDNHARPDPIANAHGAGGAVSLDCTTCTMVLERNFFGSNQAQYAGAASLRGNDGVDAAALTLHNTSFVGNHAQLQGGAFYVTGARMDVRHLTFHDNGAETGAHAVVSASSIAEWSNSVLADVADGSGAACSLGAIATIAVGNFMRAGETSCNLVLPGTTPIADPGVLGVDDGERMPVLVFDPASPVVDGGDDGRCVGVDARGRVRPQDGNNDGLAACDAGAFEHAGLRVFGDGFED